MKIVILDGYTVNPGDLDWRPLEKLGQLRIYDRTAPELVPERAAGAEIVLTNKAKVTAETINGLPGLQYIGEMATGFDNVDIKAAAQRNIPVCNVPGYSTAAVAQLTFAFILELIYKTGERSAHAGNDGWVNSPDFSYGYEGLFDLQDKTLALIGFGQIGSAVARIGRAFGMKVIANVRNPSRYNEPDTEFVTLNECFERADFLSFHCPLTDETRGLLNAEMIGKMKPAAHIINTARGGIVNENDLAEALNTERIAGATLDVLSSEPPSAENPLLSAKNCLITPHIGWATIEARQRVLSETVKNIEAFLNGQPRNVVNGVKPS